MVTGLWFGFRVPQSLNLVERTRRSFLGLVRGLQFEKRLGGGPPGALLAPDVVIEAVGLFQGWRVRGMKRKEKCRSGVPDPSVLPERHDCAVI
jgi:hypothetical protein